MNDNDTVLRDLMREWRDCPMSHIDRLADLQRRMCECYGPAPTMHAMEPSPEWLARHKAAGELLRAAKAAVQSWPSGAAEINALRDAIEAAERAGVR